LLYGTTRDHNAGSRLTGVSASRALWRLVLRVYSDHDTPFAASTLGSERKLKHGNLFVSEPSVPSMYT
jgi:hypothetical protein